MDIAYTFPEISGLFFEACHGKHALELENEVGLQSWLCRPEERSWNCVAVLESAERLDTNGRNDFFKEVSEVSKTFRDVLAVRPIGSAGAG